MTSVYISGHHASVLRSHEWRSVANSASYLVPYLSRPDMTLLDVGCGPGTITIDFAERLPQGHVYGIDPSPEVIQKATALAKERGVTNVTFEAANLLDLRSSSLDGWQFDIVHAHQVLQHIPNPIEAIQAMRTMAKPGGILAIRNTDFASFSWWPLVPGLDDWRDIWQRVARADGCDPDCGRRMLSLCLQAGFPRSSITSTAGSWCYCTPEERSWWSDLWMERMVESTFPTKAIEYGFATKEDFEKIVEAWRAWGASEDAWFGMLHSETICRV